MTTTMNTKPLYEQLLDAKILLSANLAKLFPRTTFTIETVSEKTSKGKFVYIALKWENDGIMRQVKKMLETIGLDKTEMWVCPIVNISFKHAKLVEQKAKLMGFKSETVTAGWNYSGALYKEEFYQRDLDKANERLYADIEFDYPIIDEIFQMAI